LDKAALQEYQRVLMNDVDIALLAAEQIEHYSKSSEQDGIAKLWLSIHAFLVTTANISKMLWPRRSGEDRATELRASLSIGENDPVFSTLKSNDARNYFEHFDERLDKWVSRSKSRNIADFNPWGKSPDLASISDDVVLFRNFDVSNFAIIYGREIYPLKPVVRALWELYERVRKAWFINMGIPTPFASNRKIPDWLSVEKQ
jgi:hypothetical protein